MDQSTTEKLAEIVRIVEALPSDSQELLVAEFAERVAEITSSAMSTDQRAEVKRRLSKSTRLVPDEDVRKLLRQYSAGL